jgi:hypothetical protein
VLSDVQKLFDRVLSIVRTKYPEAVIAGGAPRDAALGKPIKDIDVWVIYNPDVHARATERNAGDYADQEVVEVSEFLYCKLREWADGVHQNEEIPVSIIQMGPNELRRPEAGRGFTHYVLDRFDYGLCRIAYNGNWVVTHEFLSDVRDKYMRLNPLHRMTPSKDRIARLHAKYPDYRMEIPVEHRDGDDYQ